MKTLILSLAATLLLAGAAEAACYADYKAKREDPLRLHYGVAEIEAAECSVEAAAAALTPRLARDGWALLNVVSVFDESGLEERRDSAGPNYLRY